MRTVSLDEIQVAAEAVDAGQLVVVPTSRWYMICGDATNPDVCARIYEGKRRPTAKSLMLALPEPQKAYDFFDLNEEAAALIGALWPGDLALRLPWQDPRRGQRHAAVGERVGLVSCPTGPLGHLARAARVPIACTSANISGQPGSHDIGPSITLDEVHAFVRETGTDIAVVVDGGVCPQFNHTTVVDCSGSALITRQGTVHRRAISAVLRREVPIAAG